ncbi:transposase [Streptomyces sp. NBC_01283]|uniref:transposase n=1 Tax=Streptomyces sp. NBC_01283 TaxID=2903812 RepID=UPI00352CD822|nr:transposase [Streptomyces sp. NBC_01283]WSL21416.1 transposase [Streptomyces sp. NBC_01283]
MYLPGEWTSDAAQRRRAGVPQYVTFAAKTQLALDLLDRLAVWDRPMAGWARRPCPATAPGR